MEDVRRSTEMQWMPHIVKELADLPAGGSVAISKLDRSLRVVAPGAVVAKGDDGLLVVMPSAVLQADATATDKVYKVKKYSQFQVGQFVTSGDAAGVKAYAITKIDRTNSEYDSITVETSLGVALTAGQGLHEVAAEDATGGEGKLVHKPLGIAKNELDLTKNHVDVGVTLVGTIQAGAIQTGVPDAYRKEMNNIVFL